MLYLEKKKNSLQFCCAGRMKIGFFVTSLAVMLIHSVSSRRTTALCPTIMHALGFVDSTHSSHGSCHHCSPQPAPRRLQHLAHHRHTIRATNRTTAATATATATTATNTAAAATTTTTATHISNANAAAAAAAAAAASGPPLPAPLAASVDERLGLSVAANGTARARAGPRTRVRDSDGSLRGGDARNRDRAAPKVTPTRTASARSDSDRARPQRLGPELPDSDRARPQRLGQELPDLDRLRAKRPAAAPTAARPAPKPGAAGADSDNGPLTGPAEPAVRRKPGRAGE